MTPYYLTNNKKMLKIIQIFRLLMHTHQWTTISKFMSTNKHYGHEHYICNTCGVHMHIKRFWNRKPLIKLINKTENK